MPKRRSNPAIASILSVVLLLASALVGASSAAPAGAAPPQIDLGPGHRIDIDLDMEWVISIEYVDAVDKLAVIGDKELRLLNPDGSFHKSIALPGNPTLMSVDGTKAVVLTKNPQRMVILDLQSARVDSQHDPSQLPNPPTEIHRVALSQGMVYYLHWANSSFIVGWLDTVDGSSNSQIFVSDSTSTYNNVVALPFDRDSVLHSTPSGVTRINRSDGSILAASSASDVRLDSHRLLSSDSTTMWMSPPGQLTEYSTTTLQPTGNTMATPMEAEFGALSDWGNGMVLINNHPNHQLLVSGSWKSINLRHDIEQVDIVSSGSSLYAVYSLYGTTNFSHRSDVTNYTVLSIIGPDYVAPDPQIKVYASAHGVPASATQSFDLRLQSHDGQTNYTVSLPVPYGSSATKTLDQMYDVQVVRGGGQEAPRGTYFYNASLDNMQRGVMHPYLVAYKQRAWVVDFYPSAYTDLDLFITEQFDVVLRRDPTETEMRDWLHRYVYEGAKPEDLAGALLASYEYRAFVHPVDRLYQAYFRRWPDSGGQAYWVDLSRGGLHLNKISGYFAASDEFVLTYGSLGTRDFVDLVYRNVMDRPSDEAGAVYWTQQVDTGVLTRGEMMVQFSESIEYRHKMDGRTTARDLVFGELGDDTTEAEYARLARDYDHSGGDMRPLIKTLLDSNAYFNKFWWEPSMPLGTGAQLRIGSGPQGLAEDQPADLLAPSQFPPIERH